MKLSNRVLLLAALVASSVPLNLFGAGPITETNFSTRNFNTNVGYVRGSGIISTLQPANLRWQGNDPFTGTLGETDVIQGAAGYTPVPPLANSSLLQGGSGIFDGILPGTNDVRIWKSFAPSSIEFNAPPTVRLFAEWSIIPSLLPSPYNLSDTFSFDLRNAANSLSLLTLQFTPGINLLPNSYTLQTIASGRPTNTIIDLGYQALFQMTVALTGTNYSIALAQINPSTRTNIINYPNLASGSLSTGMTALDFATLSLDWELKSGVATNPGSNYLLANQFQVTTTGTPVPEPGTWAACVLLLGIACYVHRRNSRLAPVKVD